MREITYRQAVNEALAEEMERDPNVFLMGEEVAEYNGAYKISQGLLDRFGPKRVIDAPIAEAGFAGLGVGAAMAGLRPIIEFMTFSFSLVAFDQIVNNAPNMLTMSGGQFHVPVVFRGPNGPAHQLGATHSHATECWYANVPGLKIVMPATPRDAKGLLKTAVRDDNPVLVLESEMLYSTKGEVEDLGEDLLIPFGKAAIHRPGSDVTILCYAQTVRMALAAAETLAAQGINAEVLDLRSIKPLDLETILEFGCQDASRRGGGAGPAVLRDRLGALLPDSESTFSTNSTPRFCAWRRKKFRCLTTRRWRLPCCRARIRS